MLTDGEPAPSRPSGTGRSSTGQTCTARYEKPSWLASHSRVTVARCCDAAGVGPASSWGIRRADDSTALSVEPMAYLAHSRHDSVLHHCTMAAPLPLNDPRPGERRLLASLGWRVAGDARE